MPKSQSQSRRSDRTTVVPSEAPFDEMRDLLRGKSAAVYPEVLHARPEGAQAQAPRRPDLIDAALAVLEGCKLKPPGG